MDQGRIIKVSGPLVVADGMHSANLYDLVRVSQSGLIGEIIEMRRDQASIQVYEETSGVGPGAPVVSDHAPLSVELGPGLLGTMFDGIQRPLKAIEEQAGLYLERGVKTHALDREREWDFVPLVNPGDSVEAGDPLGYVQENKTLKHYVLTPPSVRGVVEEIRPGKRRVTDVVAVLRDGEEKRSLTMIQKWPVRQRRPVTAKMMPKEPLITGQRIIDTFFPVAKGGTACVPGPFGSGKTLVQHQLAKWSDCDVVIYIGCGERGNEMADVVNEFPRIIDPRTGDSIMNKTVLIANTSNMPVAAREASIYTGMTIAEYFRDMGLHVALMADSSSRWAEALREMSGRLKEMPGDDGYPAYLGSRLADLYERAGQVVTLGQARREGSLTMIGAVSPPGGDISEPVSQATLRIVKVFWGLDSALAYQRHFPAVNWLKSYSLYQREMDQYMDRKVNEDFSRVRKQAMQLLQEEHRLNEIVRLVGRDTLSDLEQLALEAAKSIREDFLMQNAFHADDTYSTVEKQYAMLAVIMRFFEEGKALLEQGVFLEDILSIGARGAIARMKFIAEDAFEAQSQKIAAELTEQLASLRQEEGQDG